MATKINDEDIKKINVLYKKMGTYAAVARELGFSPSTVKKYVVPNFDEAMASAQSNVEPKPVEEIAPIEGMEQICEATELTSEDLKKTVELWKELLF